VVVHLGGGTGRMLGRRGTATFRRLYDKVKHLKRSLFFTDDWQAFSKVICTQQHIVGKNFTAEIERDNSNTRHHLATN